MDIKELLDLITEEYTQKTLKEESEMIHFNEALQETANELKNTIDSIVKGFQYIILENVFYNVGQAKEIGIKLDKQLRSFQEDISNLYNLLWIRIS